MSTTSSHTGARAETAQAEAAARAAEDTQANKDAIRRLYRALEAGDVDVADEMFTEDFVTSEGAHQNVQGPQGFKDAIRAVHSAYTDPSFDILDMVAEGDAVTLRWRMSATHTGELMGIPATGRPITMEAFALFRFVDGRISERHAVIDRLGLLHQLQQFEQDQQPGPREGDRRETDA